MNEIVACITYAKKDVVYSKYMIIGNIIVRRLFGNSVSTYFYQYWFKHLLIVSYNIWKYTEHITKIIQCDPEESQMTYGICFINIDTKTSNLRYRRISDFVYF